MALSASFPGSCARCSSSCAEVPAVPGPSPSQSRAPEAHTRTPLPFQSVCWGRVLDRLFARSRPASRPAPPRAPHCAPPRAPPPPGWPRRRRRLCRRRTARSHPSSSRRAWRAAVSAPLRAWDVPIARGASMERCMLTLCGAVVVCMGADGVVGFQPQPSPCHTHGCRGGWCALPGAVLVRRHPRAPRRSLRPSRRRNAATPLCV